MYGGVLLKRAKSVIAGFDFKTGSNVDSKGNVCVGFPLTGLAADPASRT